MTWFGVLVERSVFGSTTLVVWFFCPTESGAVELYMMK